MDIMPMRNYRGGGWIIKNGLLLQKELLEDLFLCTNDHSMAHFKPNNYVYTRNGEWLTVDANINSGMIDWFEIGFTLLYDITLTYRNKTIYCSKTIMSHGFYNPEVSGSGSGTYRQDPSTYVNQKLIEAPINASMGNFDIASLSGQNATTYQYNQSWTLRLEIKDMYAKKK